MRIGLISDTHIPEARDELWPQAFEALAGVDVILHGGDIHEMWVIDQLEKIAPIYVARGNGEDGSGGRDVQPDDPRCKEAWLLEFEGVRIGLTHYIPFPEYPPNMTVAKFAQRYFPGEELDVIVYGDTHVESIDDVGGILCVNPGSPTYPHNLDTQLGTIGFLDVQDGKVDASVWQLNETGGITPFDWSKWKRPHET